MQLQFIKKLKCIFNFHLFSNIPNNILAYGILKSCKRCSYQKSNESILIYSKDRGPRIVMGSGIVLVKYGDCIGYKNCGKCFEQSLINNNTLPCKWKKIGVM